MGNIEITLSLSAYLYSFSSFLHIQRKGRRSVGREREEGRREMEAPSYLYGIPSSEFLHIDDLLDFSNEEMFASFDMMDSPLTSSTLPEPTGIVNSPDGDTHGNSSDGQDVADELCVPSDDVAELEWLSNFVEDSFSGAGYSCPSGGSSGATSFWSEASVPGRARSKRSRAAVCDWTTRIVPPTTHRKEAGRKQKARRKGPTPISEGMTGRKCTHCASEKTPQWRAGPMGPKTLCNACGVRYKSGRLVPEYRPAASPTFVVNQHSNSHRKVVELRRQKELRQQNSSEFFVQPQDFEVF